MTPRSHYTITLTQHGDAPDAPWETKLEDHKVSKPPLTTKDATIEGVLAKTLIAVTLHQLRKECKATGVDTSPLATGVRSPDTLN